jgi:uroporphyrinogen decarboxylase
MNSRERFRKTMQFGTPDRVPYFEEGIRTEVLRAWKKQGLSSEREFARMFPSDKREEIELELEPMPRPKRWPASRSELGMLRKGLNPEESRRWPADWKKRVRSWRQRNDVLMLRVHRGFFLSMGVYDWKRFVDVAMLTIEDPEFVRECMRIQGEFAAQMAERVLDEVEIDAAVFTEPIGGNDRPLISPAMYEDFVLANHEPLLSLLRRRQVETIIFRTFANSRLLIPSILKCGFNCLWACEVDIEAMDYRELRREFGRDLRLIGGIDLDVLRCNRDAIRREIEEKVPPLLADGGYIPLADGRVREDVAFENYTYYRQILAQMTERTEPPP